MVIELGKPASSREAAGFLAVLYRPPGANWAGPSNKTSFELSLPSHASHRQFSPLLIISQQERHKFSLRPLKQRSQRGFVQMSASASAKLFQYTSGRWL
jgi:hypothetical protein